MYTLKIYKVNDSNNYCGELLLSTQTNSITPLIDIIKNDVLGLGEIDFIDRSQMSKEELMLVSKDKDGVIYDFCFEGEDILDHISKESNYMLLRSELL